MHFPVPTILFLIFPVVVVPVLFVFVAPWLPFLVAFVLREFLSLFPTILFLSPFFSFPLPTPPSLPSIHLLEFVSMCPIASPFLSEQLPRWSISLPASSPTTFVLRAPTKCSSYACNVGWKPVTNTTLHVPVAVESEPVFETLPPTPIPCVPRGSTKQWRRRRRRPNHLSSSCGWHGLVSKSVFFGLVFGGSMFWSSWKSLWRPERTVLPVLPTVLLRPLPPLCRLLPVATYAMHPPRHCTGWHPHSHFHPHSHCCGSLDAQNPSNNAASNQRLAVPKC